MLEVLLLIEKSSHCLSYYDISAGKRLHTVELPEFPHEFVLNSTNTAAYIGHYGVINSGSREQGGHTVLALDVARGEITHTLDLGEDNNRPHGIGMDAQDRLYVLAEGSSKLLVWDDPSRAGPNDREAPTGGKKSHLFALSADGHRAFSMNLGSNDVTLFDPFDPDVAPIRIETGEMPEGRVLTPDERILYITTRGSETLAAIDTEKLDTIAETSCPGDPARVFLDTKRDRLMTINHAANAVTVFESDTLRRIDTLDLAHPPISISFNGAVDTAFLSVDDNKLLFVDLDDLTVTGMIDTFREPDVSATVILDDNAPVLNKG